MHCEKTFGPTTADAGHPLHGTVLVGLVERLCELCAEGIVRHGVALEVCDGHQARHTGNLMRAISSPAWGSLGDYPW